MPIYEYQCTACKHVFDVLQKLSDDPLTDCPECARPKLRKLISAPNFRLKGGGWYETDFKDKNKRNLAGDDGKPASASASDSGAAGASNDKSADKSSDKSSDSSSGKSAAKSGDKSSGDKAAAKPVEKKASKPKAAGGGD